MGIETDLQAFKDYLVLLDQKLANGHRVEA